MKKLKMDLQLFDEPTGHSITIYKDGGVSSATAKSGGVTVTTNVAKDARVDLYITLANGYTLKSIDYLSGDNGSMRLYSNRWRFNMPDEDVVLVVTSREGLSLTIIKDNGVQKMEVTNGRPVGDALIVDGLSEGSSVSFSDVIRESGYVFAEIEALSGDAEVGWYEDPIIGSPYAKLGSESATVIYRTKRNNAYVVTENVDMCVNDRKLKLRKNTKMLISKSGTPYDIEYANGVPTEINETLFKSAIDGLIEAGVLVKV